MKIGISGAREGMSSDQRARVLKILSFVIGKWPGSEFHHGDCVGVDVEAANIAKSIGFTTISHPPKHESMRAFHESDKILKPKGFLERNRDIVDSCETMLIVPLKKQGGGTWYTYSYSVNQKKQVILITRDKHYE